MRPPTLFAALLSSSGSSVVSFSQRFTNQPTTSSQGANEYPTCKPVMLCGRPKRCNSDVVAVTFSAASCRSYPKGASNRPTAKLRPLPMGATAVTLNRCKLTSVAIASSPNCSMQVPVPGQPAVEREQGQAAESQGENVLKAPMLNWSKRKSVCPGSDDTGALPANSGTTWIREL